MTFYVLIMILLGNNEHIPQCDFLKQSSSVESVQLDTQFVQIPMVQLEDGSKWMVRNMKKNVHRLCSVQEVSFEFVNVFSTYREAKTFISVLTFSQVMRSFFKSQ